MNFINNFGDGITLYVSNTTFCASLTAKKFELNKIQILSHADLLLCSQFLFHLIKTKQSVWFLRFKKAFLHFGNKILMIIQQPMCDVIINDFNDYFEIYFTVTNTKKCPSFVK